MRLQPEETHTTSTPSLNHLQAEGNSCAHRAHQARHPRLQRVKSSWWRLSLFIPQSTSTMEFPTMLTQSPSLSAAPSVKCCHLACGVAFGIRVLEQTQDQDSTGYARSSYDPTRSRQPGNHSQPQRTSQGEPPGCAKVPGLRNEKR